MSRLERIGKTRFNNSRIMSRVGRFSSSQIYRLMSGGRGKWTIENTGKAFDTYVNEKRWERKLGRPLNKQTNARPTSWGTLVEQQAFNKMGMEYSLKSDERYTHETLGDYWSGSPDLLTDDVVGDIKCPYTLESFTTLLDIFEQDDVQVFKKLNPMYYWQLVSNAILCDKDVALLVVYVPYKSELEEIKELTMQVNPEESNRYAFINWAEDEELPYILDGGDIEHLNFLQFKVPQEDKELLTERVKLAVSKL